MFFGIDMAGNYDSRKVDRYEDGDLVVSTARVTDSDKPYETAVMHPLYNDGKFVIVELYDTEDEARNGHEHWVRTMTQDELPDELRDVSTASIVSLSKALGYDPTGSRKKKT